MEVTFDELSISRDSRTLSVKASVNNGVRDNFVITNISVDTCATFNEMLGHPSGKPIINEDYSEEPVTHVEYEKTDSSLFKKKMLFVWVTVSDGTDTLYYMNVLINWYCVYQKAMCYVRGIPCNNCKPPVKFIDFILKIKGLEYSLFTDNYTQAIKIWKSLYAKKASTDESDCGCK